MYKILCTVHEGSFNRAGLLQLEAALTRRYAQLFGEAPVLLWCELPRGQGFTEGRPSDVSFVMVEVEDGLDQARREAAMLALAQDWASVAGVGIEKLMITLADRSVFALYLRANRERLRPLSRPWYLVSTLAGLWSSKRREGYLALRANL